MSLSPLFEHQLLDHLGQYVSSHKKALIRHILDARTRHLTVVLENINHSQNASAVVRTCECMGVQDIYLIEDTATYKENKDVLKGAVKWMTMHRYNESGVNNAKSCISELKKQGYRLVSTTADPTAMPFWNLDLKTPFALVFGNEQNGISNSTLNESDSLVHIPMYGFTKSLNISASVAFCLGNMMKKIREDVTAYGLTEEEKQELRLAWYKKVVRRSTVIEQEFLKSIS